MNLLHGLGKGNDIRHTLHGGALVAGEYRLMAVNDRHRQWFLMGIVVTKYGA